MVMIDTTGFLRLPNGAARLPLDNAKLLYFFHAPASFLYNHSVLLSEYITNWAKNFQMKRWGVEFSVVSPGASSIPG